MSSFLALPRSLPAAFLTLFLTCGAAFGQTTLLSPNSLSALHLVGGGLASGSIQTVTDGPTDPVSGTVYTQAWDVNVTSTSTPPVPYNVKLYATNAVAVAKGEALVATFFYRRVDDTPDEANVNAYFESQASPITKAVSLSLRGRKTWRRASIPFICDKDYAVGGAQFDFQLSWQIQHIQVAGFTLVTYGQKSVFASGSIDATPSFSFSGGTWATDTSVAVTGQPFFTAASKLQMTVWPPHWDSVQLTAQVPLSGGAVNTIHSGDTLVALFWMCGTSPDTVNLAIGGPEAVGASGTLSLDQGNLMVDSTWKQHYVAFTAKENYAAGALHFYFRCGMKPQTVQFAGLQLIDLGSAVAAATLTGTQYDYPGRAIDASWRTAANTRIAQNREGTLTVNVTGASNQALSGVAVSAAMTKHLFGFGAEVSGQRVANGTGADSDRYRAETASLFNKAVLGNELKWLKWIESGDPAVAVSAMAWLRQKGIFDLRGHNLIWPSWTFSPSALSGMTTTQLQQAILDHFADEPAAPGVRQLIGDWDVVNESHKQRDILDKLEGMPAGQHGTANDDASWIASWLAAASAADPYPYLFLNDYGTEDNPNQLDLSTQNYQLQLIANLQNAGAPIDGFGFQSHMNLSFTSPAEEKMIFDKFGALLPDHLQVTEYDNTNPDPLIQADYMADYLTLVFSDPNFDSFILWDFWQGENPVAAIYDANWNLMGSGEAWKALVFGKWWTTASATTNTSGAAAVTGFLGHYSLTASAAGITKTYYADLPGTGGAVVPLQLSGSSGTSHVWMHEAENGVFYAAASGPSFSAASDTGASGGAYLLASGGSGTTPASDQLRIDTEASGTVNVWVRVISPDGNSDSLWIRADGGTWQNVALSQSASWHWSKWGSISLASGQSHSISFSPRENNVKLDEVLITDDLSFIPH